MVTEEKNKDKTESAVHSTTASKNASEREPVYVPFTKYRLPRPIENITYTVDDSISSFRDKAIEVTPASVVNNSSHVLATVHMASELLMFKAAHNVFLDKEALIKKNGAIRWFDYIIEPPKSLVTGMASGVSSSMKPKDFLRPSFYVDSVRGLFDLEHATKIDWEAAKRVELSGGPKAKLLNRFQTRSTMVGMVGWGLSLFVKDNKEDPEEVQKLAELRKENPLGYMGKRVKQAVDFTHWSDNKAQMIGGFVTLSGMFSMLSGLRNVTKTPTHQYYRLNTSHCITGLLTFAAGNLLLFGANKEESFKNFGAAMMGRLFFLPTSLRNKYAKDAQGYKDPGRHYYSGGMAGFQSVNFMSFIFGGVEKNPDGSVVDQSANLDSDKGKKPENKVLEVKEKERLVAAEPELGLATA